MSNPAEPAMTHLLFEPKKLYKGVSLELGISDYTIPLDNYHKNSITALQLKLSFRGQVHIKIGVWQDGYSYVWLTDKVMKGTPVEPVDTKVMKGKAVLELIDAVKAMNGMPALKTVNAVTKTEFPEDMSSDEIERYTPSLVTSIMPIDISSVNGGNLEIKITALADSQVFFCEITSSGLPFPVYEASNLTTLCNFIFPKKDLCTEEPLYFHLQGKTSYFSIEQQHVTLPPWGSVDFTSYFNSFSACKWQKYTNVDELALSLDFSGEIEVELCHLESGAYRSEDDPTIIKELKTRTLYMGRLRHETRSTAFLHIEQYPTTGIIGCRVRALSEATIYGGGFSTPCAITQPAKLGISITTFKREEAVKASAKRISAAIADYKDKISLTIVDNGKTLTTEDVPGTTLIPSRNLGGTGGFMRGLIHYQDLNEGFTHCLFMDDDAFCETESIFRALAFIEHAKDDRASICGAMLYENIKFLQWENGAWFEYRCHPLKHNLDLREQANLVANEIEDPEHNIYGAWWFFLFPLAHAKNYAFPFFVRGDDIDFSYNNDFQIITVNGLSCWQEDFNSKANALSVYLAVRSHIVHHLTLSNLPNDKKKLVTMINEHFNQYNNSYHYGTAACVTLAVKHVMQGPKFFLNNLEMADVIREIKELSKNEIPQPMTGEEKNFVFADKNLKTKILPKVIRNFSLHGHLLPKFLMDTKTAWAINKDSGAFPNPNRTYLRKKLYIIDVKKESLYVLIGKTSVYIKNKYQHVKAMLSLYRKFYKLKQAYTCNVLGASTPPDEKTPFMRGLYTLNSASVATSEKK